jgi:hypothetical protein
LICAVVLKLRKQYRLIGCMVGGIAGGQQHLRTAVAAAAAAAAAAAQDSSAVRDITRKLDV